MPEHRPQPTLTELSQVAHTLRSLAGADVQAKGIDVRLVGSSYRVDIVTAQPGRVIGRRGATADQIRSALATLLDDPALQLNIQEAPFEPPPSPPPAGVREPRRPGPSGPSALAAPLPGRGEHGEPEV